MHHDVDAVLDGLALLGALRVVHDHLVEVAVADVAEHAREEPELVGVFLGELCAERGRKSVCVCMYPFVCCVV